jgi:opacity protein-like surface antigen
LTFVAAAFLTLTWSEAFAQAGAIGIGTGGGGAFPVGRLDDFFKPGPGYAIWLTAGLLDNVELELQLAQSLLLDRSPEPGFIFGDYDNLTVTTVTVGPRVYFLDPSRVFRPWLIGGIGYTRLEADDSGNNPVPDDDRFGFDLGGGFDLGRPNWAIRLEARYLRNEGSSGEQDLAYVTPMVSFTYRFLPTTASR